MKLDAKTVRRKTMPKKFKTEPSIMTRLSEAIEQNTKIYRGTDPHIDTTAAVVAILKIYEGSRYEDVMRGGKSVAQT